MEEIVKDIECFWSKAMQNLKEVVEKDAREVVNLPASELGLPLASVPSSQDEKNHNRCK